MREDFVTNSSSSSFIISKNDVSYDKLTEIILEIANLESIYRWDEEENYENYDDISYRYIINEGTSGHPYKDWDGYTYNNHFIVDNDSCCRYDWDAVEEVLAKYDIPWMMGYCD